MFEVSAGGCNTRHPISFLMSRPHGLKEYLMLLVKTRAVFTICDREFAVEPNSILLIEPDTPYRYYSLKGNYVDDWLHFTCTDSTFFEQSGILLHMPVPVENPDRFTNYLEQIMVEYRYASERFGGENVDLLMQVLFHNLADACAKSGEIRDYNPYHARLQNLRLTMQAEPYKKYMPKDIADSFAISTSYFQHLYKDYFAVPFQTDLIHMRLDYAKDLIRNTNLTMERIVEMCGYGNEVHFYRQFKKYTGVTPATYRNH